MSLRTKISMKLVYKYMAIFFNFQTTSNHLHPLQVENCDSSSRLVVDEMTMVNSGLKGLNRTERVLLRENALALFTNRVIAGGSLSIRIDVGPTLYKWYTVFSVVTVS